MRLQHVAAGLVHGQDHGRSTELSARLIRQEFSVSPSKKGFVSREDIRVERLQ